MEICTLHKGPTIPAYLSSNVGLRSSITSKVIVNIIVVIVGTTISIVPVNRASHSVGT